MGKGNRGSLVVCGRSETGSRGQRPAIKLKVSRLARVGMVENGLLPGEGGAVFATAQHDSAELVGELFAKFSVANQKAHVNRAVEGIEEQIEVAIPRKFATVDATLQGLVGLPAPGPEEPFAKGLDQFGIGLASRQKRGDHLTAPGTEYVDQPTHLETHVVAHGSGVGEAEFYVGAGGKGVGDQGCLGRPPAVDGCFADIGVGGDRLDTQIRKPALLPEKFQRTAQNGLAGLLATGPSRRPFSVRSIAGSAGRDRVLRHKQSPL